MFCIQMISRTISESGSKPRITCSHEPFTSVFNGVNGRTGNDPTDSPAMSVAASGMGVAGGDVAVGATRVISGVAVSGCTVGVDEVLVDATFAGVTAVCSGPVSCWHATPKTNKRHKAKIIFVVSASPFVCLM